MSAITNVWRQLVQRRLWPVAILLIAALAAVPTMLAKNPGPPAPTPAVVTTDSGETALATEPIVAQATAADRTKRRNVLGTRKDPFGVPQEQDAGSATAPSSDGSKTAVDPVSPSSTPTTVSGGTPTSPTSPTVTGPVSPTTPTTPTPAPAPKTYAMHELTVRFGESADGAGSRRSLERLQPLPSKANPVLIYLGVLKDGKTAVFLVDQGVSAVGDGDCRPTPVECETVRLRAGETEFFDVLDEAGGVSAQYQLDLLKIHKGRTTSATRAQASSTPGRRLLHARVAADGPTGYRWDASAGALERSGAGLRASVASSTVSLP